LKGQNVKTLAILLALSASTCAANAGVLCAFDTPDKQGFSFGYVEGSGKAPDFPTGMYRLYDYSSGGHSTKWDEKTGGPAWAYTVVDGADWTLTSVDDTRRAIQFSGKHRVPGSTRVDLVAVLSDKGGPHVGVCEIGGMV
jgi:hypothetical protein